MLRDFFDRWRARTREYAEYAVLRGAFQQLDRFLYSSPARTRAAPHVRDSNNVQRLYNNFVIASLPCWAIGLWNVGQQTLYAMMQTGADTLPGWRGALIGLLTDTASDTVTDSVIIGLLFFLPVWLTALATGAVWEAVFAVKRRRAVDEGLLCTAWLFTLIMPPSVPLLYVVIGMSFATVFGKGIFGGTGRYLFSPPLLGAAFLMFSYPGLLFGETAWIPVPGYIDPPPLELAALEGGVPALQSVGYTWPGLFLGIRPGGIGTTSTFGCLLGALYLVLSGAASWRIMAGSALGMISTVLLFNALGPADDPLFSLPWTWHLVIGGWAFGTVFIATDPVAAATTQPGRWGFGALVGVLTIVVRVTNPSYAEGAVFAILLACVFSPLFDYVVVQRNAARRARRATLPARGLS